MLSEMTAFFTIILGFNYQPNAKIYIFDRYGKLMDNKNAAGLYKPVA
jgi:hypothetical protein